MYNLEISCIRNFLISRFFVFANKSSAHFNRENAAPTDCENLDQLFF